MLKSAILILGSSLLLGLSAVSVQNLVDDGSTPSLASAAASHSEQLEQLNLRLAFNHQRQSYLKEQNLFLMLENKQLKDSIAHLQRTILHLNHRINTQVSTIQHIQTELAGINQHYEELKAEISRLISLEKVDKEKIAALEKEKAGLRIKMNSLHQTRASQELEKSKNESRLTAKRNQELRYLQLSTIINSTKVKFQKIALRKKKLGRSVSKISKNDQSWNYTAIEFFLEHEDPKSLLNQTFIIKILDADTYELLSYRSATPDLPQSGLNTKGIPFRFDGNLVEASYFNDEKKTGKNYELQVYYLSPEGKEYLLANGTKSIVSNRKVKGS